MGEPPTRSWGQSPSGLPETLILRPFTTMMLPKKLRIPDGRDVAVRNKGPGEAVEELAAIRVEQRAVGVERTVLYGDDRPRIPPAIFRALPRRSSIEGGRWPSLAQTGQRRCGRHVHRWRKLTFASLIGDSSLKGRFAAVASSAFGTGSLEQSARVRLARALHWARDRYGCGTTVLHCRPGREGSLAVYRRRLN
jgi:hypothetical protein